MSDSPFILTPPPERWRARIGKKWARYPADVLPAWVADMDFVPMQGICDSIREAVDIADIGYPPVSQRSGVPESFARWAQKRWGWKVDPAHVHLAPDVVGGMDNCLEALSCSGDGALVQTPIYPPFMTSVRVSGRKLVDHALIDGQIDFDGLEKTLHAQRPRIFLLCNPHNPTGRCFSKRELRKLAGLVLDYDLIVVSDEIHADLIFDGRKHVPFASLDPEIAARTITLTSASKAFNIAGLRLAVCVVSNPEMRERLLSLPPHRWAAYSTLGVRATLAAWTPQGEQWLAACVAHLQTMRDRLASRLLGALPGIRHSPTEATYLAWFDCRALGLRTDPYSFFLEQAHVGLSPGPDFGPPGAGHVRINFATSREILDEIIDRMVKAYAAYRSL